MKSRWRILKAARDGRLLKRERQRSEQLQGDLWRARDAADRARQEPLARIKARAIDYLAGRTADAIAKARDEFLKRALEAIEHSGMNGLTLTAEEDRIEDRATTFTVIIPRTLYCFRADLGRLADDFPP